MIFDLQQIEQHFNKKITGVIHVGAFIGEEIKNYSDINIEHARFFEPQIEQYEILKKQCEATNKDYISYNIAIGSQQEEKNLYISERDGGIYNGSGASSSLLRPRVHLTEHPEVRFVKKIPVKITTLDSYEFTPVFNMMNVDVQGFELEVFKGATNTLKNINYIICEVNRDEVYEGCPRIEDISEYLNQFGFTLVHTMWQSKSWGDALYVKLP
jgi:FkbM family methyltransferase